MALEGSGLRRPRRVPGTFLEHEGARLRISGPEKEAVVVVNESAAAVFELCDGETTIDEMVTAICDASSTPPARARDDVEKTLVELERAGLVNFGA